MEIRIGRKKAIQLKITIIEAQMKADKESGYVGRVNFQADGHKAPYEITLHSKKGKEWMYSLNFWKEPGSEEEILAVEEMIEEDDDLFDLLIDTAKESLKE